ncbi:MAG TPA: ThuA domain-containing protein [Kofleriaceae bacterium]|nr:ThuA domain-containing protein [Kofleriaceae bacterium]
MREMFALVALAACGSDPVPPRDTAPIDAATDVAPDARVGGKVLLFSRTSGFRHDAQIARALDVLPPLLETAGFTWTATEEPLTATHLAGVDGVVFLYTTGNDIVAARDAFEAWVRAGGAFVGLHSATDTEYAWPFYQQLVVAAFDGHPAVQVGAIDVIDAQHPAMAPVPARWVAADEWYNFSSSPAAVDGVRVLANLDETTYTGGSMGTSHAIAWAHERFGGRAVYTALGHPAERWEDPVFVDHVLGAIAWALRNR